jgi:predicted TIM-barrel fold metal-dependent hydrolase
MKIFDSLTHPTINGEWFGRKVENTFEHTAKKLHASDFCGACAVGLDGRHEYEHKSFISECNKHPELIPIAAYNPLSVNFLKNLNAIAKLGFKGIKIHPRISEVSLSRDKERLIKVFAKATELSLPIFLCTYYSAGPEKFPDEDPLFQLASILNYVPETKIILLHGGGVRLMEYAELVKFNPNLLLDLSFTIMKYRGSSLDIDCRYLFENLDRKLCIGTDGPEYGQCDLRKRFEDLSEGLSMDKKENIAFRNIMNFLGLKP